MKGAASTHTRATSAAPSACSTLASGRACRLPLPTQVPAQPVLRWLLCRHDSATVRQAAHLERWAAHVDGGRAPRPMLADCSTALETGARTLRIRILAAVGDNCEHSSLLQRLANTHSRETTVNTQHALSRETTHTTFLSSWGTTHVARATPFSALARRRSLNSKRLARSCT